MGCASSVPAEGRVNQNAADAKEVPAKQKGQHGGVRRSLALSCGRKD